MLLIVNAGMRDNPVSYGIVGGSLQDFNRTWFNIVGNTLLGTLIINVIMPVVESTWKKFKKFVLRGLDQGFF